MKNVHSTTTAARITSMLVIGLLSCMENLDTTGRILCGPISEGANRCPSGYECRYERRCCPIGSRSCPLAMIDDATTDMADAATDIAINDETFDVSRDKIADVSEADVLMRDAIDVSDTMDEKAADSIDIAIDIAVVMDILDSSDITTAEHFDTGFDTGEDVIRDAQPDVRDAVAEDACDPMPGCSCTMGPLLLCGTTCVDTRSDTTHCGRCGRVCPARTVCIDPSISSTCSLRVMCENGECVHDVIIPARAFGGFMSENGVWEVARNNTSSAMTRTPEIRSYQDLNAVYLNSRGYFVFPPLSAFPDLVGIVRQCSLIFLQLGSAGDLIYNVPPQTIHLVSFTPASFIAVQEADYGRTRWGGISFGSREYRTFAAGMRQRILLNAEGVRFLQIRIGTTQEFGIGLTTQYDILEGIPPGMRISGTLPGLSVALAESTPRYAWLVIRVSEP